MTSTSHTLTQAPSIGCLAASMTETSKHSATPAMLPLLEAIKSGNRHAFLQPDPSLPDAALQLAKATLDAYAGQVSDEQQRRQRDANKKRKRADNPPTKTEILKIRKLHVDGFENGQVWQQARRIISTTLQDSTDILEELQDTNVLQKDATRTPHQLNGADEDELEDSSAQYEDDEPPSVFESGSGSDMEDPHPDELPDEVESEDADEILEDGIDATENGNGIEDGSDEGEELVQDPNGLNDGFFSIDNFNKQTQWFENADARADPGADQASDDEEIDWHADPLIDKPSTNGKPSKKHDNNNEDEAPSELDEDEDQDGGPTFGDMDLDAPEGDSDDEFGNTLAMEEDDVDFNANDIFYKDFFAPPQRKGARTRKPRAFNAPKPVEPDDHDIGRAMADVRRDLFEDGSEREDSDDALSDVSAGNPKARRSAHERRQARLAEEIRQLEAANVAKKEWTMAGEARAVDRPMNSLLEEDLDFEHVGKPVPVITTEVNEGIEDMIKRRILAQEFDEVIRRRPDSSELSSSTRRGLADLDDTKGKQSLAEIYEEEHTRNANPDTYVSKADEKLQKEEKEIEQMWRDISAKLDSLSSWHYKPKPAAPSLTVVSDVATISMEDAQPTTAQGVSGGDHTLAPQEIYKAGKGTTERGEVVGKNGLPVAKQEMSREDKARKRRREKDRARKAGNVDSQKPPGAKAQERQDTLSELKKSGVKVINKKGEIVDMDGNKGKAANVASGGTFKL
ncbi:U3 small nucleolar ribonucleoprotein complex, subunit Mpp10 [Xylariomycetidae sp. FL2044]|nr:U3 small nucleolar ribonucleoprotein complex, subunit Mpp10 [Xylariomycetidae sp. FL2044]